MNYIGNERTKKERDNYSTKDAVIKSCFKRTTLLIVEIEAGYDVRGMNEMSHL